MQPSGSVKLMGRDFEFRVGGTFNFHRSGPRAALSRCFAEFIQSPFVQKRGPVSDSIEGLRSQALLHAQQLRANGNFNYFITCSFGSFLRGSEAL